MIMRQHRLIMLNNVYTAFNIFGCIAEYVWGQDWWLNKLSARNAEKPSLVTLRVTAGAKPILS